MKKRILILLTITISSILMIACIMISCIMIVCHISSTLPTGEFIKEVYSPDNTYVVKAYVCLNDATNPNNVRCEVVEVSSGESRNIYWQNRQEDVEIEWINNTVVSIDDVKLDVQNNEYYDYREHYSIDDDLEYWDKYLGLEDFDEFDE